MHVKGDEANSPKGRDLHYPVGYLIAIFGYIFILLLEKIIFKYYNENNHKVTNHKAHKTQNDIEKLLESNSSSNFYSDEDKVKMNLNLLCEISESNESRKKSSHFKDKGN